MWYFKRKFSSLVYQYWTYQTFTWNCPYFPTCLSLFVVSEPSGDLTEDKINMYKFLTNETVLAPEDINQHTLNFREFVILSFQMNELFCGTAELVTWYLASGVFSFPVTRSEGFYSGTTVVYLPGCKFIERCFEKWRKKAKNGNMHWRNSKSYKQLLD